MQHGADASTSSLGKLTTDIVFSSEPLTDNSLPSATILDTIAYDVVSSAELRERVFSQAHNDEHRVSPLQCPKCPLRFFSAEQMAQHTQRSHGILAIEQQSSDQSQALGEAGGREVTKGRTGMDSEQQSAEIETEGGYDAVREAGSAHPSSVLTVHESSAPKILGYNVKMYWVCPECHRALRTRQMLHRHFARKHMADDDLLYSCHKCDQKFRTLTDRNEHARLCFAGEHNPTPSPEPRASCRTSRALSLT